MDNWGNEPQTKSKDYSRMILVAIMVALIVIILIIAVLLISIQSNTFKVLVDGEEKQNVENLFKTVDNTTYVSIQDLATILKYDYHSGEYKSFHSDEDKCYIKSTNETASFYLNSSTINKLEIDHFTDDYEMFTATKNTIQIDNKMYAPVDAIQIGFNIKIEKIENGFSIITLNKILTNIEKSINKDSQQPTYKSLLEESFENQKAVLYNYVILSKRDTGLYGVVTTEGKEFLPDKYTSITFLESTKEFLVTNSLGKTGIIDQNGRNKIEQSYDSIKVINNNPKLYLVEISKKYGVVDQNGGTILYTEYDSIGIDNTKYKIPNQYILLDRIIPVSRNKKYGAFDITGKKILDIVYDGIGYNKETAELKETTKTVNPVVAIEECKGIVVQNGELYGLYSIEGKEMVPARVNSIYSITLGGKDIYYMIYNNEEINLIERLIKAGVIEDPNKTENTQTNYNNTMENTAKNANVTVPANTNNNVAVSNQTNSTNNIAPIQ